MAGADDRIGILTLRKREYPDPAAQPSWQQPRSQLTLRINSMTSERQDALGEKLVFSGTFEDSTFKVPFVSHRISYPLIRNSVYKFYSAYVLLVL